MSRVFRCSLVLLLAAGCQLPDERPALRPLPEDAAPLAYAELLVRARRQADAATDAFHVNNWADLDDAGKNLEQTARFLGRATDVPDKHKDTLPAQATDLGKEAAKLRDAVKDKDVKQVNEVLQRVHLKVRSLRLQD